MRVPLAIVALLLAAAPALAQSNIGLSQYPAPKCAVPAAVDPAMKPEDPNDPANANRPNSEGDVFDYNRKVRAYNTAMRAHNDGVKTYTACVESYIAAGKADIQRIQAAVDAAVAAANGQ